MACIMKNRVWLKIILTVYRKIWLSHNPCTSPICLWSWFTRRNLVPLCERYGEPTKWFLFWAIKFAHAMSKNEFICWFINISEHFMSNEFSPPLVLFEKRWLRVYSSSNLSLLFWHWMEMWSYCFQSIFLKYFIVFRFRYEYNLLVETHVSGKWGRDWAN